MGFGKAGQWRIDCTIAQLRVCLALPGRTWAARGGSQLRWYPPAGLEGKKEVRSLQLSAAAIFDIKSYGNDLFVASGDGVVTVIELDRWVVKERIALSHKNARVLAINPNSRELAIGYSDHAIRVLSLDDYTLKYDCWAIKTRFSLWSSHRTARHCSVVLGMPG